jgi:hypothetical protein
MSSQTSPNGLVVSPSDRFCSALPFLCVSMPFGCGSATPGLYVEKSGQPLLRISGNSGAIVSDERHQHGRGQGFV